MSVDNSTEEVLPGEGPLLVIEPVRGWVAPRLRELWSYRELLYFLAWRDVKVRYKQTALGGAWAILQPLLTMLVFSVIFGVWAKLPSGGVPYPIFILAALLPWQLFAHALNDSGNSVILNQQLITKVYFPRLAIPVAAILAGLVDFGISFGLMLALLLYYGIVPGLAVLLLPVFILLALATALGAGLWLSALNVEYRDVRYVLPFLAQFWFFITPVAYSSQLVPEKLRSLYGLNPMAGVVEGFRWALLGNAGAGPANVTMLAISTGMAILLLVSGLYYFRRMERTFSDVI